MLDFHEKRKLKAILYSWPTIFGLCVVVVFLCFSVYERYGSERSMLLRKEELARELETLEARAALLDAEVNYLRSERGKEEELRDRYQISKKGEEIIVLVGEDDGAVNAYSSTTTQEEKKSLFDFLSW